MCLAALKNQSRLQLLLSVFFSFSSLALEAIG